MLVLLSCLFLASDARKGDRPGHNMYGKQAGRCRVADATSDLGYRRPLYLVHAGDGTSTKPEEVTPKECLKFCDDDKECRGIMIYDDMCYEGQDKVPCTGICMMIYEDGPFIVDPNGGDDDYACHTKQGVEFDSPPVVTTVNKGAGWCKLEDDDYSNPEMMVFVGGTDDWCNKRCVSLSECVGYNFVMPTDPLKAGCRLYMEGPLGVDPEDPPSNDECKEIVRINEIVNDDTPILATPVGSGMCLKANGKKPNKQTNKSGSPAACNRSCARTSGCEGYNYEEGKCTLWMQGPLMKADGKKGTTCMALTMVSQEYSFMGKGFCNVPGKRGVDSRSPLYYTWRQDMTAGMTEVMDEDDMMSPAECENKCNQDLSCTGYSVKEKRIDVQTHDHPSGGDHPNGVGFGPCHLMVEDAAYKGDVSAGETMYCYRKKGQNKDFPRYESLGNGLCAVESGDSPQLRALHGGTKKTCAEACTLADNCQGFNFNNNKKYCYIWTSGAITGIGAVDKPMGPCQRKITHNIEGGRNVIFTTFQSKSFLGVGLVMVMLLAVAGVANFSTKRDAGDNSDFTPLLAA